MNYRTIVNNQESIKKLTKTNLIPWEVALELADFAEDIERVSTKYNKAHNVILIKFGKLAEENDDKNTVDEQEEQEKEIQELLDRETDEIRIPEIEVNVIKKLYTFKKEDKESKEDEFNIDDIKAYKALGILKVE